MTPNTTLKQAAPPPEPPKSKIISVTVRLAKAWLIIFMMRIGLEYFDKSTSLLNQDWRVYFLLYVPIFAGFESIIASIAKGFLQQLKSD